MTPISGSDLYGVLYGVLGLISHPRGQREVEQLGGVLRHRSANNLTPPAMSCPLCSLRASHLSHPRSVRVDYRSNLVSLLPLYPKLIGAMSVLIYSGDADACVPWNGRSALTQFCARPSLASPSSSRSSLPGLTFPVSALLVSYNWTRNLGMKETVAWRPWMTQGDGRSWVGGFATQWGANFSFVTIKHAGHVRRTPPPALHAAWST